MKFSPLKGDGGQGQRVQVRRTEEGAVVVFVLGVFFWQGGSEGPSPRSECVFCSINEREGAGRGRRSAGQERHGSKAALLGAGEASEEVTMAVVLSSCQGKGVGGGVEGSGPLEHPGGLNKGERHGGFVLMFLSYRCCRGVAKLFACC